MPEGAPLRKAVFLDKDGTLVEDVPYSVDTARIRLTNGCAEALRRLQRQGYRLIVISNQAGLARGLFSWKDLIEAERHLARLLATSGIAINAFYYCPHHPEAVIARYRTDCRCRKPLPGMIERAAQEHAVDLSRSWLIGDILNDIEAGKRAGCRTILIDNAGETEWLLTPQRIPDHIVRDMEEAAEIICRRTLAADVHCSQ